MHRQDDGTAPDLPVILRQHDLLNPPPRDLAPREELVLMVPLLCVAIKLRRKILDTRARTSRSIMTPGIAIQPSVVSARAISGVVLGLYAASRTTPPWRRPNSVSGRKTPASALACAVVAVAWPGTVETMTAGASPWAKADGSSEVMASIPYDAGMPSAIATADAAVRL
jgi:hypothetical protein